MTPKRNFSRPQLPQKEKRVASGPSNISEERCVELRKTNHLDIVLDEVVLKTNLRGDERGREIMMWKIMHQIENVKKNVRRFRGACYQNTRQNAGWAVCRHVRHNICNEESGRKRFQSNIGNESFQRHMESQKRDTAT